MIAFGDEHNDTEMLSYKTGWRHEKCQACSSPHANEQIEWTNEDGVARKLQNSFITIKDTENFFGVFSAIKVNSHLTHWGTCRLVPVGGNALKSKHQQLELLIQLIQDFYLINVLFQEVYSLTNMRSAAGIPASVSKVS